MNKFLNYKIQKFFSSFLFLIAIGIFISGCQANDLLVNTGLITPTPTPDPYSHYRAILQPDARFDIEALLPLPTYHITARLENRSLLKGVVQVTIPRPQDSYIFRLYPNVQNYNGAMRVTKALINQMPVQPIYLDSNSALKTNALPSSEDTQTATTIRLDFEVDIGDDSSNFTLFGWNGPILTLPGFYPFLSVTQNGQPVIDEPSLYSDVLFSEVALYQLDLTLPKELVVVSSGVTLNLTNNPDDTRTWQIAGGPLRDMTVIAGPFQATSETAAGAVVTSYYLKGHEPAGLSVLAHAAASLRLYSELYGPYPYTELDVVEAPLDVRGMEYSGLILIGDSLYQDQRKFLTFLVAHEVGHQWWYSLVGNNPYRHPWLDEGLTEYGAFSYYKGVFGQQAAEELLLGRWQIPFEVAANGGIDGRVDQPADQFNATSYELLVYGKAALFFNALREELGEEMYYQVLQTYYTENRYKITNPQIFLATAQRVSGRNLNPLAEQWLR